MIPCEGKEVTNLMKNEGREDLKYENGAPKLTSIVRSIALVPSVKFNCSKGKKNEFRSLSHLTYDWDCFEQI